MGIIRLQPRCECDTIKDLQEGKFKSKDMPSDHQLQAFSKPGIMKNVLGTVMRIYIVNDVCKHMTLEVLYLNLGDDEIAKRAKELFHLVHGDKVHFDTKTLTIQIFLSDTISVALTQESNVDCRKLALRVTCELSFCLTSTVGEGRKKMHRPYWVRSQSSHSSNNSNEEDYCGGGGGGDDDKTDARYICCRTFFNMFLAPFIEQVLYEDYGVPTTLFGDHGFVTALSCFAQTNVRNLCNFSRVRFFEEDVKEGSNNPIKMEDIRKVVSKINMETNLILQNKEQVDCLQRLFKLSIKGD